jgi:hypothetical protein
VSMGNMRRPPAVDFPLQRENESAWRLSCLPLFMSEKQER